MHHFIFQVYRQGIDKQPNVSGVHPAAGLTPPFNIPFFHRHIQCTNIKNNKWKIKETFETRVACAYWSVIWMKMPFVSKRRWQGLVQSSTALQRQQKMLKQKHSHLTHRMKCRATKYWIGAKIIRHNKTLKMIPQELSMRRNQLGKTIMRSDQQKSSVFDCHWYFHPITRA